MDFFVHFNIKTMRKLATVFYLMAYVASSQFVIANKRPLRSVLAPAEIITNYETVSPIIIYQSAETIHGNPHNLWIKFHLPGKTFELHLTMNKNLLSPQYTETYIEDGKTMFDKGHKNCFYHGTVVGFADWTVAMSTCAGLRGTFGNYDDIDTLYHIEPLGRTTNEIEKTHVVFDSSVLSVERRNGTCGCNDSHIHKSEPPHNFTSPFDRVRRQSATRIVEWFIFNDRRRFLAHNQSLTRTALNTIEIANIVDMFYAKIGIRVTLVGIQTWKQDLITVVEDPDTLLKNLRVHLLWTKLSFDSAMLITGIDLTGDAVGLAGIGTMCSKVSAGLTQDTGSSVAHVATTAAHELGHIFNMRHDNRRGCACNGVNNVCIMTALRPPIPPMEWSNCSVSELNAGFAKNLDHCLFNEPTKKCGNGVREDDEMCDCGTPETCEDPCCNPNTCQFADAAVCLNHEPCCSNCQFKSYETVCRSATSECDITEYCTGNSAECPSDRFRQDGADCANGQAYCSGRICQNLNAICSASFTPYNGNTPSVGPQVCFNHNTAGTQSGNCGHNSIAFLPCATADVRCGQLHCRDSGNFRLTVGSESTRPYFVPGQGFVRCKTFGTRPGGDVMVGMVPEGAKCGTNMLCRNRQCVARQLTACPSANSEECSGNGICNDLNQCSCNPGFIGTNCNTTATKRINGGWGSWTNWSSCSVTCGDDHRTRQRSCDNPSPSGGGSDCSGNNTQREACNIANCPVDGSWSQWSSWSSCSVTCGVGSRTQTRMCTNPSPQGGGADCVGISIGTESCNTVACPVNGGWGSWTRWSSCSVTCGDGHRTRQRSCDNPSPSGGGSDCSGNNTQRETCNIANCPVNGGWGSWTNWSSCSVTCGDGHRTRQRSCDNPSPSEGGSDCSGNNTQRETYCNIANCPVNGGWGSWTSWSSCSTTCGDGHRIRQRFCNNPVPSEGGIDCSGNNTQREICNIVNCPVNGGWGSWTRWSSCSVTCGDGHRTRQRSCDNPSPSGGRDCSGNNTQRETCNIANCPVNGGWGSWTSWSSCSVTCGDGHRTRQRSCDNPEPSGGGSNCSGNSNKQHTCSALIDCPAEEDCSVTEVSGKVKQRRNRTRFRFSSNGDPRATYRCKLDDGKFKDCEFI